MLKSPVVSLSLFAAVAAATLTGLPSAAHAETGAAAAPKRVQITQLAASYKPTTLGTEVTVGYTLKNRTAFPRSAQFVRFYLLPKDGGKRALFGRAKVRPLASGDSVKAKATRRVGPRFVEGDYRVRVCYSRRPQAVCTSTAVTPRAAVTIAPAKITADDAVVGVPAPPLVPVSEKPSLRSIKALRVEAPTESARIVFTNTGQARTGPLALAIEAGESNLPETMARAMPSTSFAVEATTCKVSLSPGRSCTVDVTRIEGSNPFASDRLVVQGKRGAVGTAELVAPVRVTPGTHDFGDVAVGEVASKTFTVANESDETISVLNGYLSDGTTFAYDAYDEASFTCAPADLPDGEYEPVAVPAGGSCTITVVFAPQGVTDYFAIGILETSVGIAPFFLNGTGTPGDGPIPVRPGARSFGGTR